MKIEYPTLSKSHYLDGLQCPKLLWYEYNEKHLIKRDSPVMQFVFEEGRRVGRFAQKLFPDGILLERNPAAEKHAEHSLEQALKRKPLFEAGFIFGHAYALADILEPVENDMWDIYEVKSGTCVTDVHYYDVAFQKHTYEGAGLKINKCYLMHINKEYVRKGEIEPEKLFTKVDITEGVNGLLSGIDGNINKLIEIIKSKNIPDINIGPQCSNPHDCPLQDKCWEPVEFEGSIFSLYSGGKKCFGLWDDGTKNLIDIPDDFKLSEKQLIQIKANKKGNIHIDKPALKDFLDQIGYPVYFLDFETISPAIPIYDNTSPYEAVPFQYSLDICGKPDTASTHFSYIAPGDIDPRPEILRQLKERLGSSGSILAYWATFEIQCLKKSSAAYPEYQQWFDIIQNRFIDLYFPFKNFYYYNPKQGGSASLKKVLPAVTGQTYKGLEIGEGGSASAEYYRVTFDPNVDPTEKKRVLDALLIYCNLDTSGMVDIYNALKQLIK